VLFKIVGQLIGLQVLDIFMKGTIIIETNPLHMFL